MIKNEREIESKFLLNRIKDISKNNKIYFYPSSFEPHKNHKVLLNTFNKLSLISMRNIKLILTIDKGEVPIKYRYNELIYLLEINL